MSSVCFVVVVFFLGLNVEVKMLPVFFFVALLLLCKAFILYVACPDPVFSLYLFQDD